LTSLLDRFIPRIGAVDDDNGWASSNPIDDYWYGPRGGMSPAGMLVTQETALKISAFFACIKVLAETVHSAPLPIYRRLPNGDREAAPEHPLYRMLHDDEPNEYQTSGEWLETHTAHTAMRGTSYSRIRPGRRGPFDHFEYLHPDCVMPERLPSGEIRYKVTYEPGRTERVPAEEMFRFPGLGFNGVTGQSILETARNSLGISLALQNYAGGAFAHGVRNSGVLQHPGKFKDQAAADRLRSQWSEVYAGSGNAGKTVILEEGMTYLGVSMNHADAQMLESEQWQVTDVARWFRMPLIMIQEHEKNTSWGAGVEQQQIGFLVFTMLPWFVRWERRVNKELVRPFGPGYFAEFTIENLLRANVKERFEAYNIAAGGNAPWLTRNEIRKFENRNAGPAELDDFLQPLNMGVAGQPPPQPRGTVGRQQAQLATGVDPRMKGYAGVLAAQLVHKETTAMQRIAKRHADDGAAWSAEVTSFYQEFGEQLSRDCYIQPEEAHRFATEARDRWLGAGIGGIETAQLQRTEALLGLMLEAN